MKPLAGILALVLAAPVLAADGYRWRLNTRGETK